MRIKPTFQQVEGGFQPFLEIREPKHTSKHVSKVTFLYSKDALHYAEIHANEAKETGVMPFPET